MGLSGILCPRGKQGRSCTARSEVVQQTVVSGRIHDERVRQDERAGNRETGQGAV